MAISAVVNTYNEEANIERCLASLSWVDEIVVVDMGSNDSTLAKAKKYTKHIYSYPYTGYVEPARNFAIQKSTGDWLLIVDADEEVPSSLTGRLIKYTKNSEGISFYRIPRKNIIFGKWIQHGQWWPDHQIRFFQKGAVWWQEEIHSVPYTQGIGKDIPADEHQAIIHNNYQSISQYIERLDRYTSVQAKELEAKEGYIFEWKQMLSRPLDQFLRKYFLAEGYKDGLHGLALALLQAFSELIVVCKLWEHARFCEVYDIEIKHGLTEVIKSKSREFDYWFYRSGMKKKFPTIFRRLFHD